MPISEVSASWYLTIAVSASRAWYLSASEFLPDDLNLKLNLFFLSASGSASDEGSVRLRDLLP